MKDTNAKNTRLWLAAIFIGLIILAGAGIYITKCLKLGDEIIIRSKAPAVEVVQSYPEGITDEMISECIVADETKYYDECIFYAESHRLLGVQNTDGEVIIYLNSLFEGFNHANYSDSGSSAPIALTFSKVNSDWEITEYWYPLDGADYVRSIKEKFPKELWEEAIDKNYVEDLIEENKIKSRIYFGAGDSHQDSLAG